MSENKEAAVILNDDIVKSGAMPGAGLNMQIAQKVSEILFNLGDISAVTITDRETVLSYIGPECMKHPQIGMPITTAATRQVIESGEMQIVHDNGGFFCEFYDGVCELESAVIAPLTLNNRIVGVVKLYHRNKENIPVHVLKLAEGAAQLLSMQIELAEKDHLEQLMITAQLEALQAKINPHFLFNTISTIIALIRTDPEKARELLLNFSAFFRTSLKKSTCFITLREELDNVKNYLVLEKARFGDKLKIITRADPELMEIMIPSLCIQPLVENSIIHGISPKEGAGTVCISVHSYGSSEVKISVSDDGVGISPEILPLIKQQNYSSGSGCGVGLSNVSQRLCKLFGESSDLVVKSKPGNFTTISFIVEKRYKDHGEQAL